MSGEDAVDQKKPVDLAEPKSDEVPEDAPAGDVDEIVDPLADAPEARADEAKKDAAAAKAEPAAEAAGDPDAIVRAAKAMRDVDETRQARSRRCLVVDDSRVIRKISTKIVRSMGYDVVEAENGQEALEHCKQRMPDLVLTDWQMPEMDGIAFVTALRAIPTPRAPTVVFCTSKGAAADIHEGIKAGADDYVIKPFDEPTLKAKLEKLSVG